MGYRFRKNEADDFYLRLCDAGVVRSVASNVGAAQQMPDPDGDGATLTDETRDVMVKELREQSKLLNNLANYMENAKNLRWSH